MVLGISCGCVEITSQASFKNFILNCYYYITSGNRHQRMSHDVQLYNFTGLIYYVIQSWRSWSLDFNTGKNKTNISTNCV